jgi:hypothetical protein
MRPKIILITGVARAGKDTFAAYLMDFLSVKSNNVELFKFANILKDRGNEALSSMGVYVKDKNDFRNEAFKEINRNCIVELAKTLRRVDKDIFARHLNADINCFFEFCPTLEQGAFAIVSDWRYLNEYEFLLKYQNADIVTIQINRPGYAPANEEEQESLNELFGKSIIHHFRSASHPQMLKTYAMEISQKLLNQ